MYSSALKSFISQVHIETRGKGEKEHTLLLHLPKEPPNVHWKEAIVEAETRSRSLHSAVTSISTPKVWIQGCVVDKKIGSKVFRALVDDGTGRMDIRVYPKICLDFEGIVQKGSYVLAHVACGKKGKMTAHKFSVIEDPNAETLWSFEVMDAQAHTLRRKNQSKEQ
eukprot:TRINITY_DN181_c1_g1_i1.p1 TRINITY_DN181_c1_g1~~TRINITY_DN181_c1_g1_i1.p1  ORF type:complete len:166 (-),score=42.14 TRINITY_DN181_c1_g1_i1:1081-1578(-)